nr:MAG TPA: hypothetical protein [Caudoviricetes sp.]
MDHLQNLQHQAQVLSELPYHYQAHYGTLSLPSKQRAFLQVFHLAIFNSKYLSLPSILSLQSLARPQALHFSYQ